MIYTEMTIRAACLAYDAHRGQRDETGMPYIFHPIHLAEQMDDEISTCVALLHDVVEDTDVTLEQLCQQFPREVTDAVALLTHEKGADYLEYVRRIKTNPTALKVKMADLNHNSDETRAQACNLSEERKLHFRTKYAKARAILEE